ncbi:hypothetical protein MCOR30_010578 [Pyricularia oryzae]|nr:hypothetical protein MCOR30_010578 [Pyricularia oryzae]
MRMINAFGLKPIHIATIRGQKGNVSMLVNAGTNVNEQTRHGITPLMLGALFGHLDIVALLIKNGAERSIQDAEQRTAKESGHTGTLSKGYPRSFKDAVIQRRWCVAGKESGKYYDGAILSKGSWKVLRSHTGRHASLCPQKEK